MLATYALRCVWGICFNSVHLGIVFEAYAPIGSPSRPFKERDSEPVVMEDPVIKAVAEKHNATPAQVYYCEHILYCISCPAFLVPSVSTRE